MVVHNHRLGHDMGLGDHRLGLDVHKLELGVHKLELGVHRLEQRVGGLELQQRRVEEPKERRPVKTNVEIRTKL